jgi:hypothetical protein
MGQLRLDHRRVALEALGQRGAVAVARAGKHHRAMPGQRVQTLQDLHRLTRQGHQMRVGRNGPQRIIQIDLRSVPEQCERIAAPDQAPQQLLRPRSWIGGQGTVP